MKALKIDFIIEKSANNSEFLLKVKKAEELIKSGKCRKVGSLALIEPKKQSHSVQI